MSAGAEAGRVGRPSSTGSDLYDVRRGRAARQADAQLHRGADVADEMARRLATLERQVMKAARYRRLRALVRQEEVGWEATQLRALHVGGEDDVILLLPEEFADLLVDVLLPGFRTAPIHSSRVD